MILTWPCRIFSLSVYDCMSLHQGGDHSDLKHMGGVSQISLSQKFSSEVILLDILGSKVADKSNESKKHFSSSL